MLTKLLVSTFNVTIYVNLYLDAVYHWPFSDAINEKQSVYSVVMHSTLDLVK